MWRLYTSPHVKDSKHTIDHEWSIDDGAACHLALDVLEDIATLGQTFSDMQRPR